MTRWDPVERRLGIHILSLIGLTGIGGFIPGVAGDILPLASVLAVLYHVLAWLIYRRIGRRGTLPVECQGERVLVIAPHQDDCVAMAGGYIIQTVERGGEVFILYMTDGDEDKVTRKREARTAWDLLGPGSVQMAFMPHHNVHAFQKREEIEQGIGEIQECLETFRPQVLFVPMYEGGHYHHDVTNYMTREALGRSGQSPAAFETPIYNYYMSLRTTPEKIFAALVRLIPGLDFSYRPEPVSDRPLYQLSMDEAVLALKKDIILQFFSQTPHRLVTRWGFADRYQAFADYDYRFPPFDYQKSVARLFDRWNRWPVIGKVTSRVMKWTRTIHPDASYTITQIPL